MAHTFFLQSAIWDLTGSFASAGKTADKTVLVTGISTVTLLEKKMIIECCMQLENGSILQINYEIVPFKDLGTNTTFTATSNALGNLTGTFMLRDNKIIEVYNTENRQLMGKEVMTMLDENHYTSEGALYQQELVKSSWSLNYTKKS